MAFADMAVELPRATGPEIRHIPISLEDFHANIAEAGGALVVEVIIAALCLAAFRRRLWQPTPRLFTERDAH